MSVAQLVELLPLGRKVIGSIPGTTKTVYHIQYIVQLDILCVVLRSDDVRCEEKQGGILCVAYEGDKTER